jgi:hypothetical protein
LYKKLYDIDRNGLKKAQKKWKPIFQYTKSAMAGNKKHEIIRVAQENLYMLKRLSEKTSVYNIDKWNKDYQASQYYKRSHCQYPSIDFYKTQRCGSFGNMFNNVSKNNTKKNFYSKTQYSKNFNNTNNTGNSGRKRKKFEDFSYRDLQIGKRSNSENGDKYEKQQFKKLSEIECPQDIEKEGEKHEEGNKEENNANNKYEEKKEEIKEPKEEVKKEDENENEREKKEEEKNEENMNEDKKEEKIGNINKE